MGGQLRSLISPSYLITFSRCNHIFAKRCRSSRPLVAPARRARSSRPLVAPEPKLRLLFVRVPVHSGWIVHGLLLKFQHGEKSCATCTTMDPVYGRLRQCAAAAGRQFTATSSGMGCSPIRMSAWTYSNKSAVGSSSIRMLIATLDYQRSSRAFLRKLGFAFNRRE